MQVLGAADDVLLPGCRGDVGDAVLRDITVRHAADEGQPVRNHVDRVLVVHVAAISLGARAGIGRGRVALERREADRVHLRIINVAEFVAEGGGNPEARVVELVGPTVAKVALVGEGADLVLAGEVAEHRPIIVVLLVTAGEKRRHIGPPVEGSEQADGAETVERQVVGAQFHFPVRREAVEEGDALVRALEVLHAIGSIVPLVAPSSGEKGPVGIEDVIPVRDVLELLVVVADADGGVLVADLKDGTDDLTLVLDVLEVRVAVLIGASQPVGDIDVAELAERSGRVELTAIKAVFVSLQGDHVAGIGERFLGGLEHGATQRSVHIENSCRAADNLVGVDEHVVHVGRVVGNLVDESVVDAGAADREGLAAVEIGGAGELEDVGRVGRTDVFDEILSHDRDRLGDLEELLVGLEARRRIAGDIAFAAGGDDFEAGKHELVSRRFAFGLRIGGGGGGRSGGSGAGGVVGVSKRGHRGGGTGRTRYEHSHEGEQT